VDIYQGNDFALDTLKNIVSGANEKVVADGDTVDFTFTQIKEISMASMPTTTPEIDHDTAEESITKPDVETVPELGSDPTIANAGLTELIDATSLQGPLPNGHSDSEKLTSAPEQTTIDNSAANAIGEGWDPQASITTDASGATNDEWVQVSPRDPAETETGVAATPAGTQSASWAEEVGNAAAVAPETKSTATNGENDGFEQVSRNRGANNRARGSGRGGPRGEFRGRGRGRGDGFGRGRGRGDAQGRGRGEGGRGNGGGGRGRGGEERS
jgi:hypothetical protein